MRDPPDGSLAGFRGAHTVDRHEWTFAPACESRGVPKFTQSESRSLSLKRAPCDSQATLDARTLDEIECERDATVRKRVLGVYNRGRTSFARSGRVSRTREFFFFAQNVSFFQCVLHKTTCSNKKERKTVGTVLLSVVTPIPSRRRHSLYPGQRQGLQRLPGDGRRRGLPTQPRGVPSSGRVRVFLFDGRLVRGHQKALRVARGRLVRGPTLDGATRYSRRQDARAHTSGRGSLTTMSDALK